MNKEMLIKAFLVICLIILCLCWLIHIVTDAEIYEHQKCEHEFGLQIDLVSTSWLYTINKFWSPIYIYKCQKCGEVGGEV